MFQPFLGHTCEHWAYSIHILFFNKSFTTDSVFREKNDSQKMAPPVRPDKVAAKCHRNKHRHIKQFINITIHSFHLITKRCDFPSFWGKKSFIFRLNWGCNIVFFLKNKRNTANCACYWKIYNNFHKLSSYVLWNA